ncbi:PAS domain-containing protein [Pseudoalteromonas sp. 5Ae-yellow]|uniref:PAS domain-containing protein n=1 Tax=Pseudoalteromonas sp. 5Ae-yellow TaxID=2759847 RepID=UPI002175531E|nr:PAS domain-containing protein [Pseudoalteromonas sp. 5Ae-yellow]
MDNNDELQVQIQYALVEKLSNSNRRQAKLLAILDECIFECDKHLKLTYINEAWEKKLGYSSDSLIGSNITKSMNCNDIMHFVAYSCCLLEGKQTPSVEIQIKNSHGLLNWFECKRLANHT